MGCELMSGQRIRAKRSHTKKLLQRMIEEDLWVIVVFRVEGKDDELLMLMSRSQTYTRAMSRFT
jgi:hypothetical protein